MMTTPPFLSELADRAVVSALASVLGQREDCEEMVRRVTEYCAATLRDPRSIENPADEMTDVVAVIDKGRRDLGCLSEHSGLFYRWAHISHDTLHEIFGRCSCGE